MIVRRVQKTEKLIIITLLSILIYLNCTRDANNNNGKTNPSENDSKASMKNIYFDTNGNINSSDSQDKNTWIRISDNIHVYSAFVEERENTLVPYIKLIGIKRVAPDPNNKNPEVPTVQLITKVKDVTELQSKYYCKLFYEVDGNEDDLRAEIKVSKGRKQKTEHRDEDYYDDKERKLAWIKSEKLTYFVFEEGVKLFAGTFFKCYFPKLPKHGPLFVALYPLDVLDYPDKLLSVKRGRTVSQNSLSICVRPLFGPFDNLPKVVQFIAYYESVGVSQFTIYYISISSRVKTFLDKLEHVNLFHWNLPTGNNKELWDYGTLSALQDCMYRHSGYVIIVDIDEFIVPRVHSTLVDLVHDSQYKHIDQFSIRNAFFCEEFCQNSSSSFLSPPSLPTPYVSSNPLYIDNNKNGGDDEKLYAKSSRAVSNPGNNIPSSSSSLHLRRSLRNFQIFSCPRRTKKIWGMYNRAKYIAKAEKVVSLGHHYVTTFLNYTDARFSRQTLDIPSSVALLNHYRECRSVSTRTNPVFRRSSVVDTRIQDFRTQFELSQAFQLYQRRYAYNKK